MWIYLISFDGLTKYRPGELTEELQNNNKSFHSKHLQLLRNRTICQTIRSCEVLKKSEDSMSENNQEEDSSNEGCEILVAFQNANKILKEMSQSYKILETNNQVPSVPRLWPDEQSASFLKKRQLELKMSQQSSLPFFLKRTGNSRHPHGFDFSFLVQGPCSGSNMSKPLRGLDALQEINAQIQQRLSISVLKHSNRRMEFHLSPETFQPLRTVPLAPLVNNRINKNTSHNKILSIMDSVPCPTKPIGRFQQCQSGNLQQGQTKHAVGQSRRRVSDSSVTTGHLPSFRMDNYYKYFGDIKEQETEKNQNIGGNTEENEYEKCLLPVLCRNVNIVATPNVSDDNHDYFNPSEVTNTEKNCKILAAPASSNVDYSNLGTDNWESDLFARSSVRTDLQEVNASSLTGYSRDAEPMNAVLVPHVLDSSCTSEAIEACPHVLEGSSAAKIISSVEVYFSPENQSGSSVFPVDAGAEKVTISELTETKVGELAPLVHVTFSEQELPKALQIAKRPARKKSISRSVPPNASHSFNILALKLNDKKIKMDRSMCVAKTKASSKASQDVIVCDKNSTKRHIHKTSTKNQIFPFLQSSHMESETSSKFQEKQPQQETYNFIQHAHKSKMQVLPCTSRNASNLRKPVAPLHVPRAQSTSDFLNLKYSDMFKEIHSTDKGPGIYEMFGTPVYSQAREPEQNESRFYRDVCSAPHRGCTANRCKPARSRERVSSRVRNAQKRTHPKPKKNTTGSNQKHKERSTELNDSNTEGDDTVIISGPNWHIKTSRSTVLCQEDEDQQHSFLEEFSQSTKLNEDFLNSDLSTIKEVSLEQSLDIGDITNNPIFATTNQPFYEKGCAECVTLESNLLMTDQHKCVVQGRVDMDDSTNLEKNQIFCNLKDKNEALVAWSFPDKLECESSQRGLDKSWARICENSNLADASGQHPTKQNINATSPIFQTYQNILSHAENKELTDELLCCLAAGLLVLKEKDTNSSRILMKNQGSKLQNMFAKEERCIVNGDGKVVTSEEQSYSEAFLASNRENDLLNFSDSTNLPESSSANDDPIIWTRGEILGKGAYGTVYCGLTSQGQLIAVKQVALDTSDQVSTEKEYQKLQEEVDLLKTLKHINIVTYLGTCLANNIVSIFMEFVPGGSISSIIHRFGPLPEIVLCKYTTQILQGVAYLHENRVVHRDIKGNNVMLMPNGVIKLIDFGCAKRLAWVSLNGTQSEMLNSVHGTPYWMAPEVINESGYGRKSDIWSIGCTVFEMATGKPPLASMNRIAAMFYIGAYRGLMPPLPDHFSGIAADFVHVCLTRSSFPTNILAPYFHGPCIPLIARDQHERPSALQLLEHPFIKGKQ
ncbi:PREDICTED: mitogen-activated protein kinase kinase kinase 19 isoform X1 [Gavialis gangeticus]|uniref:mitogen-activated protein kinase kinase kinase 19 isoform X1 n=1 Tax=Gavialis gangeticus TaxID=94835 RepID=UPI00092F0250|nr:PREDICTED: mitogen-activated protein kinase kinase kinase 19 isoform X1 [Gavialis gangeticus]